MDWRSDFIEAKYHLNITDRMIKGYEEYPEKRFLVGVINESAIAARKLIRSFLIFDNKKGNLKTFQKNIAPKYLDNKTIENISKILEVQTAQKNSPIEFAKEEKIIFLINGKWKILTIERIEEFIKSIHEGVRVFNNVCRHI
ncbi:hypothetical protein KAS08_06000 [Candidatus Pacearchaeota archaeon]|nr:hypothetical protein [Candidatus Pacearchaeota archaeon]